VLAELVFGLFRIGDGLLDRLRAHQVHEYQLPPSRVGDAIPVFTIDRRAAVRRQAKTPYGAARWKAQAESADELVGASALLSKAETRAVMSRERLCAPRPIRSRITARFA
jgi:hypothetical protein